MTEKTTFYRRDVHLSDRNAIREIVTSSGFFSSAEIDIAIELLDERLLQGDKSGYSFLFAEREERVIGYVCFGPISGTLHSYDLYWIAIHETYRGQGIGKHLLKKSEDLIAGVGGKRIYIETSSRSQYNPTLNFYQKCDYQKVAFLEDFYSPGDGKIILAKTFP